MHTHLVATQAWRWRNQKAPEEPLLKRVAQEQIVLISAQLPLARMLDLAMTAQPSPAVSGEGMRSRALLRRASRAPVDKAMELAGGGSFYRADKLERFFRDIQVRFHPLQDKPQTIMAGQHALGLSLDD